MDLDSESQAFLELMAEPERLKARRIPGIKTVLVVLSIQGMVFDIHSLRREIVLAYPNATVFFEAADGTPVGNRAPRKVDLLIDFTAPGTRQGLFYARKLRARARAAFGRNAGLFRKRIYNQVFDEKKAQGLPGDTLGRERFVQRHVLAMAGIAMVQAGLAGPDLGKTIALELPAMLRL